SLDRVLVHQWLLLNDNEPPQRRGMMRRTHPAWLLHDSRRHRQKQNKPTQPSGEDSEEGMKLSTTADSGYSDKDPLDEAIRNAASPRATVHFQAIVVPNARDRAKTRFLSENQAGFSIFGKTMLSR